MDDAELNIEGSDVILRPSAPVYCLDVDPAVLHSTATSSTLGAAAVGSTGGYRGRWGYRAEGFTAATANGQRALSADAVLAAPQNATAGSALVTPARATTAAAAGARSGGFWPGLSADFSSCSSTTNSRRLLTNLNPGLDAGPGGLVVGPVASGSGGGLRPRPKSSHTAAVESISKKQAVLQVRLV